MQNFFRAFFFFVKMCYNCLTSGELCATMGAKSSGVAIVKIRNPFLVSLIILGATVVLFLVGAISNAVSGVYLDNGVRPFVGCC